MIIRFVTLHVYTTEQCRVHAILLIVQYNFTVIIAIMQYRCVHIVASVYTISSHIVTLTTCQYG